MEKLWKAGVVIPIHRAVFIQLWFKVNILILGKGGLELACTPSQPNALHILSGMGWEQYYLTGVKSSEYRKLLEEKIE